MTGQFNPIYSSNSIWRDEDLDRCLTLDLEDIETDIAALQTNKANISHVHEVSDITGLSGELSSKVDKVSGKDLSTNDYTDAEKSKLAGIEACAQKNTITGVKGNAESTYRTGNVNITPANIGAAASSHNHSAANITSGTLGSDRLPTVPISKGGTGATSVAGALTNLGNIGKTYITNPNNVSVAQLTWKTIASITLPAGTYVVVGNHQWGISSAGTMSVDRIWDGSNTYCTNRCLMNGGGGTTTVAIVVLTATTTMKFDTYHEHSAAATATGIHFSAIKIK